MDQEQFYFNHLDKFLSLCEFSVDANIKGKILYEEFVSFLNSNKIFASPGIKNFYDMIETWILKQKDPSKQIFRFNYSGVVYLRGLKIKGKYDDSKDKLNQYRREKMREIRQRKAEEEGRIFIPRKSSLKINLVSIIKLPDDVSEWNQYKITLENFVAWYNPFLEKYKSMDPDEAELILNQALNNLRHAKELKPKEFILHKYKFIIRHIESTLEELLDTNTKSDN